MPGQMSVGSQTPWRQHQPSTMREQLYTKFQQDGFLILENFLSEDEVAKLKEAGRELTRSIPKDEKKITFDTTDLPPQAKDKYFIESGDKIRYFYEKDAVTAGGELKVDEEVALNKVGHNLHWLHPTFKELSFGRKVEELCKALMLDAPVILQSMYIYKNPGIGSEVCPHQDSTYLYTEPNTLIGLWFPIDDATLENGCLWFIPGSHDNEVHRRFIRNPDPNGEELLIYNKPATIYPSSGFVPYPTPKGSCVVIHGNVVHKSEANKSDKSRHAYTFHVMDVSSKYSTENWLQSPTGFPLIYSE